MTSPATSSGQLALLGEELRDLQIRFRESARSRRLCVRVDHEARVEVVFPRGTSRARVARFLADQEAWIVGRLARLPAPPAPAAFPPGCIELPAVGESWRLHIAGGSGRARLREVGAGLLQLRGAQAQGGGEVAGLLRRWVVRRARELLPAQVAAFAARSGERIARVQVRTQRTRWGSCSTRGVISLNAAVLFQPPAVLRYLLAHELAHLAHMNHSRAFWARVAALEPDWQALDRALLRGWERVPHWFRRGATEE